MARRLAELPKGSRISDYISLGVIAKTFPIEKIEAVLAATGKASVRRRELPAQVVVYYVIALALYMQSSYREVLRCLLEGLQWLSEPGTKMQVAGNSAISQARSRLGATVLRQLHDELVQPIASAATPRRLVSAPAAGEHRWQHVGHCRSEAQRSGLRAARGEPRIERLSAAALRLAGGGGDPRVVWHADGPL